ncbi:MAG: META domain-containing protein [Anaerolineae bacterium]|jgi:heat shock protein HslJ
MNRRKLIIVLVALALLLGGLLLAGCERNNPHRVTLAGTQWVLVTLGGQPPLAGGTAPSAEFTEDQISGSTGCNHYFGTYNVRGDTLTLGAVAVTEMACLEPEGVMDQEQAFLAALASVAGYRLDGAGLELLDGADNVVLAFESAP